MADVFAPQKRSEIMSRVRSNNNAATEVRLVNIFRQFRVTGWRRHYPLFGKPDFVFPKKNLVVFVDGCFWHNCPTHASLPATNVEFWQEKLRRNHERDRRVNTELRRAGWRILRVWQHELKNPHKIVQRINQNLSPDVL